MKIKTFLISTLLTVTCISISKAQECKNIQELSSQIKTEVVKEFSKLDSLYLTFFVQYKIDSRGKINSVWINSIDVINTDFDKYIISAKGEPLKLLYRFYKNENEIRKMIYKIYANPSLETCDKKYKKGYYLQPIVEQSSLRSQLFKKA